MPSLRTLLLAACASALGIAPEIDDEPPRLACNPPPFRSGENLFVITRTTVEAPPWTAYCNPTSVPVTVTSEGFEPDVICVRCGHHGCMWPRGRKTYVSADGATILIESSVWDREGIYDRAGTCQ